MYAKYFINKFFEGTFKEEGTTIVKDLVKNVILKTDCSY